ncbi:hypothetical protein [Metamycoplasma hominis]|uniref:hypothetical protein n=1 Tax=Metamycoplasma hominis TaxID=2098 RepID=UPI00118077C1|nr:hypothetical protein [Metamycoplasma hominis]
MKNELNSLDMKDIKNLDWVNAKQSELNKKYKHYLKDTNSLQKNKNKIKKPRFDNTTNLGF